MFTGKFERAIDLSCKGGRGINQFMEERMDAVAFARLGYIIADLYKSVKREKCISLKIGNVAKKC